MRNLLLFLFICFVTCIANAQTFKYGDLYYRVTDATKCYVAVANQRSYSNNIASLVDVVIPNSVRYDGTIYYVTSLDDDAFHDCINLYSITIPENISKFGWYSPFDGCKSLAIINWNAKGAIYMNDWSTSPRYPLTACASTITEVNLGNKVKSLPAFFCWKLSKVKSIVLPESLTTLGESVFNGCSSLTSIAIPDLVETIPRYGFYGCSSLKKITIGKSVSKIREYAFDGCDSVTTVEWNAISADCEYCYLDYYPLPMKSVTSLIFGEDVVELPANLTTQNSNQIEITLKAFIPPTFMKNNTFNNSKVKVCYIPCGTLEVYQATDWAMFPLVEKNEINIRVESDNELQGSAYIETNL